eukprot:6493278-Prorocentrum_lima.AAC.1
MGPHANPSVTRLVLLLQRICIEKVLPDLPRHLRENICPVVLAVGVVLPATLDFELTAPGVPVS